MVVRPHNVRELDVQRAAFEPALAETPVHQVAKIGHCHSAADNDLFEAQLFGCLLVGVVVLVAVEEQSAHFERNIAFHGADDLAIRNLELSNAFLLLGITQLHHTEVALAEQVALVMRAACHQLAVVGPEVNDLLDDRAISPIIDVGNG